MKDKNLELLKKIMLISITTGLCFCMTYVQIRMPAGDMVHLGNFVCILAGLLFGSLAGGVTGSVGMGLYDLINYSSRPTTIVRTIIVKFIIGYMVGLIFRTLLRKDKKYTKELIIICVSLFIMFVISLVFYIIGDKSNSFSSVINLFNTGKTIKINILIPIISFVLWIVLLGIILFTKKISNEQSVVLISIVIIGFINIILEFILRYILEGLFLSDFKTSIVVATTKIPGSVITALVTVVLIVLVYPPIKKAVFINYNQD